MGQIHQFRNLPPARATHLHSEGERHDSFVDQDRHRKLEDFVFLRLKPDGDPFEDRVYPEGHQEDHGGGDIVTALWRNVKGLVWGSWGVENFYLVTPRINNLPKKTTQENKTEMFI